jgi:hypothetical protein
VQARRSSRPCPLERQPPLPLRQPVLPPEEQQPPTKPRLVSASKSHAVQRTIFRLTQKFICDPFLAAKKEEKKEESEEEDMGFGLFD